MPKTFEVPVHVTVEAENPYEARAKVFHMMWNIRVEGEVADLLVLPALETEENTDA